MDVLHLLWIAAILGFSLTAIVMVGLVGALAITTGYRQVEDERPTG